MFKNSQSLTKNQRKNYVSRLFFIIFILDKIKDKRQLLVLLNLILKFSYSKNTIVQPKKLKKTYNLHLGLNKRYNNKSSFHLLKQKSLVYIINITVSNTNTLLTITDVKGSTLFFHSAGQVNIKGKAKTKQPYALLNLLKIIITKTNFLYGNPVAVHFKTISSYYETFIIKILKRRFFIKTVKSFNLHPHNGCRPKKLQRF